MGGPQRSEQVLDRHAPTVIGVENAIHRPDNERWDRQHPGIVASVAWKIQSEVSEQCSHLVSEGDGQVQGHRLAIVEVGQNWKRHSRIGLEDWRECWRSGVMAIICPPFALACVNAAASALVLMRQ
jgi:hypothetical protein